MVNSLLSATNRYIQPYDRNVQGSEVGVCAEMSINWKLCVGKLVLSRSFDFKHLTVGTSCRLCLHMKTLIMKFSHHREPSGPFNAHWHVHITVSPLFVALLSFVCLYIFRSHLFCLCLETCVLIMLPWFFLYCSQTLSLLTKRSEFAVTTVNFHGISFTGVIIIILPLFSLFQVCSCIH